MRVLLVTPDYPPPGGVQVFTQNLQTGLSSLGHDTHLLHLPPGGHQLPRDAVPQLLIDHWRDFPQWPYFNYVFSEASDAIETFDPDVVHSTHVTCWPALEAANRSGVPCIATTHAEELNVTRWCQSATRRTDRFHTVSRFTSRLTEQVTGVSSEAVYCIPPSIRVTEPLPEDSPGGPVVTVSRLVERKNIDALLEGWKMLPRRLRQKHGLIIAGDGPQRDAIVIDAEEDETVSIRGRISEEEKRHLLGEASLFALTPFRDGFDVEGFGIVYIEAQAHGTPVIGSDNGGISDSVGNGGLLVSDPSDPEQIADAINSLLASPKRRRDCREAIERRISSFGLEVIAQRHIGSYDELISASD